VSLKRDLGFFDVFALGSGAMISTGLFVLPAIVYPLVGPGLFFCYLLAAVLLLPTLLSKAELMTAMPKAGGMYFFLDRSFGPGFGAVGGAATWASLAFKSAFALLGLGIVMGVIWGWDISGWQVKVAASGFCAFFGTINLLGARHAGRLQILLVVALLAVLVAYIGTGFTGIQAQRFRPLLPHGWNKVLIGAGMVFISFGGITKVASLGEEVRNPHKNLVWGMFTAAGVVSLLYVLTVFVTVGLLPVSAEEWTATPIAQAGELLWGHVGAILLGGAAVCAFLTTGNAGILSASRVIMAMGKDDLVPKPLSKVSKKRGTPVNAILFTCAFMIAAILALPLELFVKAASAMKVLLFMSTMAAVALMRESRLPNYSPTWRAPLYPWLQIVGVLAYAFILVELGSLPLAIAGIIIGAALVWYLFYAKVRVLRESALVRVASRIAKADFGDHDIDAELARIARESREMASDWFDRLIADCPVLDLDEGVSRKEAFQEIANLLGPQIDRDPDEVRELLHEREELSTTVVRSGLAIPHLMLENIDAIHAVLVRSETGVKFLEDEPPVHTMFVLAAPPSQRDQYLKALVAISEITQDPDFDRDWMEAGSTEALREVVLGAKRSRQDEQHAE